MVVVGHSWQAGSEGCRGCAPAELLALQQHDLAVAAAALSLLHNRRRGEAGHTAGHTTRLGTPLQT